MFPILSALFQNAQQNKGIQENGGKMQMGFAKTPKEFTFITPSTLEKNPTRGKPTRNGLNVSSVTLCFLFPFLPVF
jgi:hypothetical protein